MQPAGTDLVSAFLVFLNLLKSQVNSLNHHILAKTKQAAAPA